MRKINSPFYGLLVASMLSGCGTTLSKIENIGNPPAHAAVVDPTRQPDYQPMSWPLPEQKAPAEHYVNSLWQPGSRSFFRDQRASRTGDILKVTIKINDKILSDNQGQAKRQVSENSALPAVAGLENRIARGFSRNGSPTNLLDVTSNHDVKSGGKITRQDQIQTQVAALVTQVLPNGNLVIEGKEEIQMNYEMREIAVKGVVRPQDITPDNTVDSTQIAEARITYGGHGQLMDMQQPRWGNQMIEILSPF